MLLKNDEFNGLDLQMCRSLRAVLSSKDTSFNVGGSPAVIKVAQVLNWYNGIEKKIEKAITLQNLKRKKEPSVKKIGKGGGK